MINYEAVTPPPFDNADLTMRWPTPDDPAVHANECSPCQCWPRWLWLSAWGSLSWQLFYKFMPFLLSLHTCVEYKTGLKSSSFLHRPENRESWET